MKPEIANLRRRLDAAFKTPQKKELVDIARSLEYASLEFERLPDKIFSLYVDVLSNPLLCATADVDEFATGIFNDFAKLSPKQQQHLEELFSLS